MARTWTARQWTAFERNLDTLTRSTMPQTNRIDPKPAPVKTAAPLDRVDKTATTRNETGRVWSF